MTGIVRRVKLIAPAAVALLLGMAADALSIPRSQADRMFLHAETQGRLGPQQVDGSRRVLLNDRLPTPSNGGPRP